MHKAQGVIEDCSPEQRQKILALQAYVRDELQYNHPEVTFWFLLRFGRARDFKLPQIKEMLKAYVAYKKDLAAKKIMEMDYFEKIEPIMKHFEGGFFYTDRQGRPVYYLLFGKIDFAGLFKKYSVEDVLTAHIHLIERFLNVVLLECSKVAKRRIDYSLAIIDFKGLAFLSLGQSQVREFGEKLTQLAQSCFPETLGKMYFINVPGFFSFVWKLVRLWVNENTRKRIVILTSDGKAEIQKDVDPDSLHVVFGGSRSEDYKKHPGPWSPAFQKSLLDRTFYPQDYQQTLYEYYLTPEERSARDKLTPGSSQTISNITADDEILEVKTHKPLIPTMHAKELN